MSKEIYISSTPHETRLAIVENDLLAEIYYERENEYTLAGSIYNGRVTRVLPGMQSSFVDIGLERDAFLYITDFMEEAGDSADFEATHGGADGGGRAPRSEGERGGEGRRGDRGQRTPETIEGVTSEPNGAAAAESGRASGERNGERDRNGRGGRGRRGRRDGRPERGGVEGTGTDRPVETAGVSGDEGQPDFSRPLPRTSSETKGFGEESPEGGGDVAGLGEGAPGADGSRRWRGRRGRRRGRGPGQDAQGIPPQEGVETGAPSSAGESAGLRSEDSDAELEEMTDRTTYDLDGSASIEPSVGADRGTGGGDSRGRTPAEGARAQEGRSQEGRSQGSVPARQGAEREGRPEGRGERDRNLGDRSSGERGSGERGRGDRGGREGRGAGREASRAERSGDRPQRVPRGFAPRTNLYGVDNSAAEGQGAEGTEAGGFVGEPIILPGESLSKYRKGGEEPVPAPSGAAVAVPPPSTAFTLAAGWDGGAVLPGESLSRRRGGEPQGRAGEERGRSDRRGREEGSGRGERSERRDSGERELRAEHGVGAPVQPLVREEIHPAAAGVVLGRHVSAEGGRPAERHEVEAGGPQVYLEDAGVSVGPIAEEQPEVAQAAYPELVPASEILRERKAAEAVPGGEPVAEREYEPGDSSASHRIDPVPPSEYRLNTPVREDAGPVAVLTEEPSAHEAALDEEKAVEQAGRSGEILGAGPVPQASQTHDPTVHATTTVSAGGNMHSEPTTGVPPPPVPSQDMERPTEPILHEEVVVQATESAAGFAPGAGELEEELIEDEDVDTATLHAGADEEFDDLEEETLEGAADLGTMLREMSIDQITRPEVPNGEDGEEDDFLEEDFAESGERQGGSSSVEEEDADEIQEQHEAFHQTAEPETPTAPWTGDPGTRQDSREGTSSREGAGRERDDRRGRRDSGRRGDRRGSSRDREGGTDRARRTGGSGERIPGRGRAMQSTNLPAISDLLKPGQEILVQIAKEPIAKKGARITSHIALPGRFLVFMPTVSHTGVSRKIESDAERQRLKRILLSEKGEAAGGFIVRTAADGVTEEELRSDLRFLLNLWADIKQRSESSKSPALIYHDLNLVERILRDQVTDSFSALWVDTESDYERILRFLQRFQPSLIRRVKLYTKETPLFEQFGITEEINKALRSKVWLKSGGSIVINQTEALVAIDINTGKFVGKTARLEDTIVKTNLDAIPEIVRQIRLRDLGGIIIIDFIDMDERKNRNKVMAALEEELKNDRAPSKVLQFNDFGLVAITRKRVKQSLERTLSTPCMVCTGTGMVKSPITVCNDIYIEMRKMHKHLERGDIMLRVHPEVVKQLKVAGGRWLQEMEDMAGKTILVKSDPSLHPEQFDIH